MLGDTYRMSTNKQRAFKKLALRYNELEDAKIPSSKTLARTIHTHYLGILNFFNNKAPNAAAESFNAKIKNFRKNLRGIRDIDFFLYRLYKL